MDFIPKPILPYPRDALAPHISAETLDYHHGKHHMAYYNKTKELVAGREPQSLERLIATEQEGSTLLKQAGQLYNHAFYWKCMKPNPQGKDVVKPTGKVAQLIDESFGSFDAFKNKFDKMAKTAFGSGWVFLVRDSENKLALVEMHDGDCPIRTRQTPVLALDLWEHAYYIDYRNARPDYLTAWWSLVNWDFCNQQIESKVYDYQNDN